MEEYKIDKNEHCNFNILQNTNSIVEQGNYRKIGCNLVLGVGFGGMLMIYKWQKEYDLRTQQSFCLEDPY